MSSSQTGDSNSAHEQFGTPTLVASDGPPMDEEEANMHDAEDRSFFVRALYDFDADDASSLSFRRGTLIEVLTQLESGWWDGLLGNDKRGWFPSNYVARVSDEEAEAELQELQQPHATTSQPAQSRPSTDPDTLAMETALLSLQNGSNKGPTGVAAGTQYADLGLGQDFDALRKLMNGISTSGNNSSDAFEQLAHASFATDQGARSGRDATANGGDGRLGVSNARGDHRMSDPSSQVESLLTNDSSAPSNHSQSDISSLHPRSNPDSLSDADGSRKLAMIAAQEANAAVRAQLELIDRERLRSHTVSGLRDVNGQSNAASAQQHIAGRPRAQTALPTTPTSAAANSRTGSGWLRSMSEQQAKTHAAAAARVSIRSGREEDSFWVPKVNERGEIYYYNTRTGQHARDLPDGGGGTGTPDLYLSDAEAETQADTTPASSSSRKGSATSTSNASSHVSKGRKNSAANASSTSSASHAVVDGSSSHDSNLTMPDSRDVPLPWTVRTSEDDQSSLFNRQRQGPVNEADALLSLTSGGSNQANKKGAAVRSSSESRKPSDATSETGPFRKTRNGRSASNAKKDDPSFFPAGAMRHADERDAWLLQQIMSAKEVPMMNIRAILDQAGDAIATLASIASEQIGPDGLSEEDVKALSTTGNCLFDTSRLSLAIGNVIQAIRTLLQASGALGLMSIDLLSATESLRLVDGEVPSAFVTLVSKLQIRTDVQDERELDSYVTSASKHAVPPTPVSLLPLGKKINATLSKLVLSARSVVEQSCLNVETRPHFTDAQLEKITSYRARIKEDSMELARALGAFGNEAQRWRTPGATVAAWTRRPQGILKSGTGVAGIGSSMFVGGAAAGWRGQGFVLPTATETAALRAEAQGSYHNPFELTREAREALSSGKVALRRKPTMVLSRSLIEGSLAERFARVTRSIESIGILMVNKRIQSPSIDLQMSVVLEAVRLVLVHFGALSALVEEIDLACALDVDGPATAVDAGRISNLDRYIQSITQARENLFALTVAKQGAYDAASSLLIFVQDESADSLSRTSAQRILEDEEALSSSLDVLMIKTKAVQASLVSILQVAELQAQDDAGSLGARAKVYGIDEVELKMVEDKTEGADDVIYLGPGLAVPNGPPVATSTTESRVNSISNAPSAPSSLRAMFQRGRSTSVATGNSAASGDSNSRILGQDETDAAIAALRGPVKTRRDTESAVSGIAGMSESTIGEQGDSASMTKAAEEVPWYLQDDTSPEDVVYNEFGQVRGATLPALLGRLTMHNAFDSGFNSTFLMTYRSFTTTDVLLNSLFSRFRIEAPEGLSPEESDEWVEKKQRPIRFRVFNVLKAWLELHFDDAENEPHIQRIKDFAAEEMTQTQSMSTPAALLLRSIERRSGRGEQMKITMVMPSSAPAPILPKNFRKIKFLDIDPLEMARQLTLMDSRLYNRIRPAECLGKSWSRENGLEIARNLRDVISANNRVSGWVSEAILVQEDVKKRAAWVKQFVAIADRCLFLNNFSSLMSIYSGLNNASLNRLRRTWDAVNQRHLQMFDNMRDILAPTRNFAKYRETLRKLNPPCVPFLGVYLTDLTFLEDGNADTLKQGVHMINFGKRQMTAEKIQEIMIYQSTPYNLTPVPGIQKFIEENLIEARSDDELFEQSLRLEPREREDEKIARLLQESGFL